MKADQSMSELARYRELAADLGVPVLEREPLANHTWLHVGGPATFVFLPDSAERAAQLDTELHSLPLPVKYLGAGSNLLVADGGLRAAVVATSSLRSEPQPRGGLKFEVLAGTPIPSLARWAADRGAAGLEFAEGIPAQLGGALRMNAGAHGSDFGAVVEEVLLSGRGGEILRHSVVPGDFTYRRSFIGRSSRFVLAAVLRFSEDDTASIKNRMLEFRQRRRATQPVQERTAGCVFANFPDQPIGKLVEDLGLKGTRIGDAEISALHGNFIINRGQARAADILGLIDLMAERITKAVGQPPHVEVEIWRDEP